jgi:hypothetical protein
LASCSEADGRKTVKKVLLIAGALALITAALALALSAPAGAVPAPWNNCTQVHTKYPHGVGRLYAHDHTSSGLNPVTTFKRSTRLYSLAAKYNSRLDAHNDGIACEKH